MTGAAGPASRGLFGDLLHGPLRLWSEHPRIPPVLAMHFDFVDLTLMVTLSDTKNLARAAGADRWQRAIA